MTAPYLDPRLAATQQPGLRYGAPQFQQPPVPPQRPGLLQRIAGGLFPAGPVGGLLDPEQLQGLQRQGLLQLGIGLLGQSGQRVVGTPGSGIGERIAAAFQGVNWPQMVQGAVEQQAALRGKPEKLIEVRRGQKIDLVDPISGQTVRTVDVVPEVEGGAKTTQDYASRAGALRGQYLTQTANERAIAQSYGAVLASANDPSPAGDIATIFAFMKMVDPGSVVREGEFATAANAGSVPERVRGLYNRALSGERLTDVQRADFFRQAQNLARKGHERLQRVIQDYHQRAQRIDVHPGDAAYDYFTGMPIPGQSTRPPGEGLPPLQFR